MQTVQLTRDYDYRQKVQKSGHARRVSAFKKNGGANKDGVYEVSDAAAEQILADGAGQLVDKPAEAPAPAPDTTEGKKGKNPPPAPAPGTVTEHSNVNG